MTMNPLSLASADDHMKGLTTSGSSIHSVGLGLSLALVFLAGNEMPSSSSVPLRTSRFEGDHTVPTAARVPDLASRVSPNEATISVTVPASAPNLSKLVRELHQDSGMTWEQLSRLFGVSRRAVHNWANGGNMTARNAELLGKVHGAVHALNASDPVGRRALLFSPGADGNTPFDQLLNLVNRGGIVTDGSYVPTEQSFNVIRD